MRSWRGWLHATVEVSVLKRVKMNSTVLVTGASKGIGRAIA